MYDVVELASSCVVNASKSDATLLEAVPHTQKVEAYLSSMYSSSHRACFAFDSGRRYAYTLGQSSWSALFEQGFLSGSSDAGADCTT
jgi:hypothetical protein